MGNIQILRNGHQQSSLLFLCSPGHASMCIKGHNQLVKFVGCMNCMIDHLKITTLFALPLMTCYFVGY